MNKLNFLLALCLLVLSCKDRSQNVATEPMQRNAQDQEPPPIPCDYRINTVEARKMIDAFNAGLGTDKRLKREFWISACTIKSLRENLYVTNPFCDGVRFFSTYTKGSEFSTLHMTLTIPAEHPAPKKYVHTNRWDMGIDNANCSTDEVVINTLEEPRKELSFFETEFRDSKPELSAGIWVNKCVIDQFATLIANSRDSLDGIKLIAAAYTDEVKPTSEIGQKIDKQSTFILFPTKSGIAHEPEWKILELKAKKPADPINHSQLCPQICN